MNASLAAERTGTMDYTRQRDWYDPTKNDDRVTLVGCGGIGSPTALALAKLGVPNLRLLDPDVVDTHNLPNQIFPLNAREPKVRTLERVLSDFSPVNVQAYQARVTRTNVEGIGEGRVPQKFGGVVIGALDSMSARSDLWHGHVKHNAHVSLYVDGRLGGENVVIYTANPTDPESVARYEDTLHSDEESVSNVCTRQSIIDVGFVVASLITRVVRRHLVGEHVEHTLFWNHERLNATVGA